MVDHIANRQAIIDQLRRELVGPAPAGEPIDVDDVVRFSSWKAFEGPYHQSKSGEEILIKDSPSMRYGVGVLYPQKVEEQQEFVVLESPAAMVDAETADEISPEVMDKWVINGIGGPPPSELESIEDDFDLSKANSLKPSTMGISFRVRLLRDSKLEISARGGRYVRKTVEIKQENEPLKTREWWLRTPVEVQVSLEASSLKGTHSRPIKVSSGNPNFAIASQAEDTLPIDLSVEVLSRPTSEEDVRLVTACLVNRSLEGERNSTTERTLFQAQLEVAVGGESGGGILPYPFPMAKRDAEQRGQEMLYRDVPIFATGHGCAADWETGDDGHIAASVSAESLPEVEIKPITAEVTREDGTKITIGMNELSSLEVDSSAWAALEDLVSSYEGWILQQETVTQQDSFPPIYASVAEDHLGVCKQAAARMKGGLEYLRSNPVALQAFRFANEAMLVQQIAFRSGPRSVTFDSKTQDIVVEGSYESPLNLKGGEGRGLWRPFQIAFLLSSIESTGNPHSVERNLIDLIWFPTGGGKTEAYLGLSAFSMFLRRLLDPEDAGVNVIMRYTLRLLTTQQFERAASLICAMDAIRARHVDQLGGHNFSIGVWVGGDTTPNNRAQALGELKQYRERTDEENPFLINKCPWCGTLLGRIHTGTGKTRRNLTPGYRSITRTGNVESVQLHCPDRECPYHNGLPLFVIDEDIYEYRPSIVIGTIDKFAGLAWRSDPRSLFGLDRTGNQVATPPQLIIQDELHLITGPLGSLSGLLEPVIEDLCTDYRDSPSVVPKIVCSTATTRRYKEQIRGLYGRKEARLFPPPGIDASDSFFATYDSETSGKKYLGIHAPGFGSYQTEWVRALAALVHAPMAVDARERDPWWTLLLFCNSLRDMGTSHTLLDTDVRDYSQVFWSRYGTPKEQKRYLSNVLELTGGLKRSQIREAMDELSAPYEGNRKAIDVCLATNIIEVGVDIQRLSLMAVAGQPKTTAQYIQATGRVGRDPEKPGLVVTLYGPSKPRDRSHFERFRGYHERLYAQVEPSSVTPFSSPALKRALHASIVAYVRQKGGPSIIDSPYPAPADLLEEALKVIRERAQMVDPAELSTLDRFAAARLDEWQRWEKIQWDRGKEGEVPLLRTAGAYATRAEEELSWSTMRSMRNVDSECHGWISDQYLRGSLAQKGSEDE